MIQCTGIERIFLISINWFQVKSNSSTSCNRYTSLDINEDNHTIYEIRCTCFNSFNLIQIRSNLSVQAIKIISLCCVRDILSVRYMYLSFYKYQSAISPSKSRRSQPQQRNAIQFYVEYVCTDVLSIGIYSDNSCQKGSFYIYVTTDS